MIDKQQAVSDLSRASGVLGGGFAVWKITPEQFAGIATGTYFTIMAGYTAWKWYRDWRKSQRG